MNDGRDIERLLTQNSALRKDLPTTGVSIVPKRYPYRPDRVFARGDMMKWEVILNGIDTPYRLPPGAPVVGIDQVLLKTELKELEDFHV